MQRGIPRTGAQGSARDDLRRPESPLQEPWRLILIPLGIVLLRYKRGLCWWSSSSPRGCHNAAQGIALGRGARRKNPLSNPEALKGRDKRTHLLRPFRAWAEAGPSKPRPLAWALLSQAFGLDGWPHGLRGATKSL